LSEPKLCGGIWLPADEKHLVEWMTTANRIIDGKLTYQYHKLERAMADLPATRRMVAVDVGAHVGLWTMHLRKAFRFVYAFECNAAMRECFERNVQPRDNVMHIHAALGAEEGRVDLVHFDTNSGHTMHTAVRKGGSVPMLMLDSFNLKVCDFIKIDVEGNEPAVISGAVETIKRCRPYMIVEDKGFDKKHGFAAHEATRMLKALGMREQWCHGGDYFMAFPAS
jgi:FkbM family methyltransferase